MDQLEIYPNPWTGVGLVRGWGGHRPGGSGYPDLEEAHWFAEGVLPSLRHEGVA